MLGIAVPHVPPAPRSRRVRFAILLRDGVTRNRRFRRSENLRGAVCCRWGSRRYSGAGNRCCPSPTGVPARVTPLGWWVTDCGVPVGLPQINRLGLGHPAGAFQKAAAGDAVGQADLHVPAMRARTDSSLHTDRRSSEAGVEGAIERRNHGPRPWTSGRGWRRRQKGCPLRTVVSGPVAPSRRLKGYVTLPRDDQPVAQLCTCWPRSLGTPPLKNVKRPAPVAPACSSRSHLCQWVKRAGQPGRRGTVITFGALVVLLLASPPSTWLQHQRPMPRADSPPCDG